MQPYYQHAGITIYHGDCREILPSLGDVGADLLLTDPPYNTGMAYRFHDDRMPAEQYAAWCREWFALCPPTVHRMIFPGHGNLRMWFDIEKPHTIAAWYKPGYPGRGAAFQFCEWEPLLVWQNGKAIGGSDVFRVPAAPNMNAEHGDHPCPKPLLLFKQIIARTKAQFIIDPFLGSGTTVVAAKHLGRQAIGIEIDERYCENAAKRLAQDVLFAA